MKSYIDQRQLAKQVVKLHENAVNGSQNMMEIAQSRSDKVWDIYFNQAQWISEKWTHAMSDWMTAYFDGCTKITEAFEKTFQK